MERKLAAIFSTDVQGYSRLMGDDEQATIVTLKTYRAVITALIEQHHGRVVDSPGDNLLAEFASVVEAVEASVAIQQELKARNAKLEAHRQMAFRIGINVGDVITDEGRLYGDGVNIAARLEGLAEAGGICISEAAYTQVKNKLALRYEYQGEQAVKNIADPVRTYTVGLDGEGRPVSGRTPTSPRRQWSRIAVGVAILLLLGTGLVVWQQTTRPVGRSSSLATSSESAVLPLPDKTSIAVLPFTNMSGDPEQEYFSDGITEDIITDLSRISSLFVIARNSVFTYKGKAVKVEEVGRELGVKYVLEGSVRKAGDRVRVTAQLVDATTSYHLWAERYDRPLADVFAVQDEIRQKIVETLKLQLTLWEQGILMRTPTENVQAYDFWLRGMAYFLRLLKEPNAQARQMFEKALELDPAYAEAYAGLGYTYLMEWTSQWSQDPQSQERASELAQKALILNDSLPLPHMLLGHVYLFQKQHEQAIIEAERTITLAPNGAEGYEKLGEILNYAGRAEEAIGAFENSMRLNPHYPFYYLYQLGKAYRLAGRVEEAVAAQRRVLAYSPNLWYVHLELALNYIELDRVEEARAAAAEILRLNPNFSLERLRRIWPFKDQAVVEQQFAALRRAGLE